MTERATRTLLYGGAFNPPTKAHAAIVDGLMDIARSEGADVWLLPSGNRRDKSILASSAIRIAYLHALFASADTSDVDTRIEPFELNREGPTETSVTHDALSQQYPDRSFVWVFGSDSVNSMPDWNGGEWLLDNLEMVVIERPGHELGEVPRRHRLLKLGEMAVSSTEVRRRLSDGGSIDDLVPLPVIGVLRDERFAPSV